MSRTRHGLAVLALILVATTTTTACKHGFEQRTIATVPGAEFVTLFDVTGTGFLDVIFTSWTLGELYWIENGPDGIGEAVRIAADLPQARNVEVAPLFDGAATILVSAFRGGHFAFEYVDGVWKRHVLDGVKYGAAGIAAADLGGSPALEVITATQGLAGAPGKITVRHILGAREYEVLEELPVVDPSSVAVADVDGDGLPDILASDIDGALWWRNEGDLRFARPIRLGRSLGPSSKILVSDLSNDGRPDYIIASQTTGVWWIEGACHRCVRRITPTAGVYHVEAARIFGRSRPDVVVVSGAPGHLVQVFRAKGQRGFTQLELADHYTTGRSIAVGDLDLDGTLEFVTTSFGLGTVDVWETRPRDAR